MCVRIGAVRYSHLVMAATLLARSQRRTAYLTCTAYGEWCTDHDVDLDILSVHHSPYAVHVRYAVRR